jgi:ABC-type branched-subunit amino acid transport system ATPase component
MLVDIKNITCAYQHHIALADVSLTAATGEIIVCIGPNGAGKSTLIRAIAGTVPVRDGQILLAGADVAQCRQHYGPNTLRSYPRRW